MTYMPSHTSLDRSKQARLHSNEANVNNKEEEQCTILKVFKAKMKKFNCFLFILTLAQWSRSS